MKKALLLMLFVAGFFISCKKEINNTMAGTNTIKTDTVKKDTTKFTPPPVTPTGPIVITSPVLLSAIIDNIAGDPGLGKPVAQFTYNGKQLTKALIYYYTPTSSVTEIDFNYDSNGLLTSTTTISAGDPYGTAIVYNGANLSGIDPNFDAGRGSAGYKITYQGGKLTGFQFTDVTTGPIYKVQNTYEYDNNGNNTKESSVGTIDGQPDPGNADYNPNYVYTNSSFDNKSNLSQALPFWIYFKVILNNPAFTFAPGTNNPIDANDSGTNFTYKYVYNNDGFPATISWTDKTAYSYNYQYIKAN